MWEEINKRISTVKQIVKDFDDVKIDNSKAKSMFDQGNILLDECLEIINKDNFIIDEINIGND